MVMFRFIGHSFYGILDVINTFACTPKVYRNFELWIGDIIDDDDKVSCQLSYKLGKVHSNCFF